MDNETLAEALGSYSHLQQQYSYLMRQRSRQSNVPGYAQRLVALSREIYAQIEHIRRTAPNAFLRKFHGKLEAMFTNCQREI